MMKQQHLTEQAFAELDLIPPLLQGLSELGFQFCTPIQALTLPLALDGRDVAGQAQTGTGKTAAFLLTIFNHLVRTPAEPAGDGSCRPRAVILAPTRELAIQIHQDALDLGKHTELRLGLVYGGTGYEKQRTELSAGVDILIGTPGRLLDYYRQGIFALDRVEVVVLDEADRMFDLGFIRDIRYVLRRMPPPEKRQSMLFSATLSMRVDELAYEHMNDPKRLVVDGERRLAERIEEKIVFPANEEKIPLLVHFLRGLDVERCLVFANTRAMVDVVSDWLCENGFTAGVLSSSIPQVKRERLLDDFKSNKLQVLVATDVAARGLHIPGVSHVINFDLPQDCEDYVHRTGRTARAGASGIAISLACDKYAMHLPEIEDFIGHAIPRDHAVLENLPELQAPPRRERRERDGERRGRSGEGRGRSDGSRGRSDGSRGHFSESRGRSDGSRSSTRDRDSSAPDKHSARQPSPAYAAAGHEEPTVPDSAPLAPSATGRGIKRELETPAVG